MLWVGMATVATQTAGQKNISSVTETISSQLKLLMSEMEELSVLTGDRTTRLDVLERSVDNSERAVGEMDSVIDSFERELQTVQKELSDLDEVYKKLLEEQDKIDEAGHVLYQKVSVQDQYLQEVKAADKQQDLELTTARFLRDEMRDELYKKEEELTIARGRLDEQNIEFFKQFEGLKADVKRQRQQASPLIQELDSCDKMTLTRINHFMRSENISPGDMEKTEKLKKFIEYISRYRKVFDEVGDLEFEVRNSERALEFNQTQVKVKLARLENLEKELSDVQGVFGESDGHYLKSAPRCVDLAKNNHLQHDMETASFSEDEEESVGGEEFPHVGGMALHRCGKVTDIRTQLEEESEEEEEAPVKEVEGEESREEHIKDEEQRETEDDEQATATDQHVKMDLSKALAEKAASANTRSTSSSPRTSVDSAMEGVTATEKHISSVTHRGDLSLSRDSRSSFVKPTHRTELRATGSSAMYTPPASSGRKQKK